MPQNTKFGGVQQLRGLQLNLQFNMRKIYITRRMQTSSETDDRIAS